MPGGFNADERAKKREEGPITIGGKTYHPRRLTNRRLREVRAISRQAMKEAAEAGRNSEDYKLAYEEAIERGATEEEAKAEAKVAGDGSDEVNDINNRSLCVQLPLLLVDDAMQPITVEAVEAHLEDDLDTRDTGELMQYLLGTRDEDPTQAS